MGIHPPAPEKIFNVFFGHSDPFCDLSKLFFSCFSTNSKWHHGARKSPHALFPSFEESPQGFPRTGSNTDLVCQWLFLPTWGGTSTAPFIHSSVFYQAFSATMTLTVLFGVPQATQHLRPVRLFMLALPTNWLINCLFLFCFVFYLFHDQHS